MENLHHVACYKEVGFRCSETQYSEVIFAQDYVHVVSGN